jgi:hypothetical protein
VTVGASATLGWSGRSLIKSSASGIVTLFDNNETSFTRLNFGGTTSSFPAWSVNGATLEAKLADDSAFTLVKASQLVTSAAATTTGAFSVLCAGTSPSRVCSLKVYDGGALRTIGSVTY